MAEILEDLRQRVVDVAEGLASGALARDVVVRHESDIMELQRQQLFEGRASSGEDIRPYYSEDLKPGGYFYSVESAGRYAAWKQDGVAYPYTANRNPDAPNLYVNGKFHSELGVEFGADYVLVRGMTSYADNIVNKYGLRTFGLMAENWSRLFAERNGLNELMDGLKRILYVL